MSFDGAQRQDQERRRLGVWDWVGLLGLALLAAGVAVLAIFALQVA